MKLAGRVWKYGDGLSATDIVPAAYDPLFIKALGLADEGRGQR